MEFMTLNKKLAVKPLINKGPTAVKQGGLAMLSQRVETVETELLFDADLGDGYVILKGSKIAFMGEDANSDWNKRVISHKDVSFVIAPVERVIMVAPIEAPVSLTVDGTESNG